MDLFLPLWFNWITDELLINHINYDGCHLRNWNCNQSKKFSRKYHRRVCKGGWYGILWPVFYNACVFILALFLHLHTIAARGQVRSWAVMQDITTIRTVILFRRTYSRLLYSRPIRKLLLLWPLTLTPRSTVRAKLSTSISGSLSNCKRRRSCSRYRRRLLYTCAAVCHQGDSFINS